MKMDMKASKEFLIELKVLTHVHHLNLVVSFLDTVAECYKLPFFIFVSRFSSC